MTEKTQAIKTIANSQECVGQSCWQCKEFCASLGIQWASERIIEKACEWIYENFYIHPHDCRVVQYESEKPLDDIDEFVEQFKKAIMGE